ncbi:hypothetical protein HK098_004068 [Nowakowskiella sp. JEL0407]|nr:hypothetical protein HK098_004068 [Nowakowskiella sp. JEL0407]
MEFPKRESSLMLNLHNPPKDLPNIPLPQTPLTPMSGMTAFSNSRINSPSDMMSPSSPMYHARKSSSASQSETSYFPSPTSDSFESSMLPSTSMNTLKKVSKTENLKNVYIISAMKRWKSIFSSTNSFSIEEQDIEEWDSVWCSLKYPRSPLESRLYQNILVRRLPVNHYVPKNIVNADVSRRCAFSSCSHSDETIEHHLCECVVAKIFWRNIAEMIPVVLGLPATFELDIGLRDIVLFFPDLTVNLDDDQIHALTVIHSVALWVLWGARSTLRTDVSEQKEYETIEYRTTRSNSKASIFSTASEISQASTVSTSSSVSPESLFLNSKMESVLLWKMFCERLRARVTFDFTKFSNKNQDWTVVRRIPDTVKNVEKILGEVEHDAFAMPNRSNEKIDLTRANAFELQWCRDLGFCLVDERFELRFPWLDSL